MNSRPYQLELPGEVAETADIQAWKAYLATVISEVRVDDHKIQIIGDKASLAAVIAGQQSAVGKVSGFVCKWRTMRDSNTCGLIWRITCRARQDPDAGFEPRQLSGPIISMV